MRDWAGWIFFMHVTQVMHGQRRQTSATRGTTYDDFGVSFEKGTCKAILLRTGVAGRTMIFSHLK